ncbi:hypothetical protein K3M67_03105 [Sphingobium sp. V4]|uniref:hypothetical protein n=1 Tax=Sphingobium sp. V4 TaxID=3038927 RepID=UPI0025583BA3|nr:hypothetical protein [Sphingobium sp. V4]WIW88985.1 hypothetical protein K3M67_03105 [Sphingobium sp. V4]
MMDLSGFRPFSLEPLAGRITPGIYASEQLIHACQVKHLGFIDGRPPSAGVRALADWLVRHVDFIAKPQPGSSPLSSGTAIERVLAGDILPEESFAVSLAEMTDGAVLPDMFGLPASSDQDPSATGNPPPTAVAGEKASEQEAGNPPHPLSASAPSLSSGSALSNELPPMGGLGSALPPGRLFHPIADSRYPEGFVLTGCGISLNLDESTATAMREALAKGIEHLRAVRAPVRRAAA